MMQLDMVRAVHVLKFAHYGLGELGSDASSVCSADVNRKGLLAVQRARIDVASVRKSLEKWMVDHAPTEHLPGTNPHEVDVWNLDLEMCFFHLQCDQLAQKHFDSELYTDVVFFVCTQYVQKIEEGLITLSEHARLGVPETSWKKNLPLEPSETQVMDAASCLFKSGGRALRDELEKFVEDTGIKFFGQVFSKTFVSILH